MSLERVDVLAAADSWVYVPDGTPQVRTDDVHLVFYPLTWAEPTAVWTTTDRRADDLVDRVVAAVGAYERTDVLFWVTHATRPTDLAEHLLARGATLHEELAVLARPLHGSELPDLDVPDDLEIRTALDLETLRDLDRIDVAVFGGSLQSDEQLLDGPIDDLSRGVSYVAHRDGVAVGSAGCTIRGGAVRLWGGAVLPEARGTGVYRALLDHRLRVGLEHGAPMALVKGRLETSAPVLRRAGFATYGDERAYRLVL